MESESTNVIVYYLSGTKAKYKFKGTPDFVRIVEETFNSDPIGTVVAVIVDKPVVLQDNKTRFTVILDMALSGFMIGHDTTIHEVHAMSVAPTEGESIKECMDRYKKSVNAAIVRLFNFINRVG